MKDTIYYIISQFTSLVIFAHVISAVVWIGGMVALRFAVYFAMQDIEDGKLKLSIILRYLKIFFNIMIPLIAILISSATIMAIGFNLKYTDLYTIVHIKEAIWTLMTLVFGIIYISRNKAQSYFDTGDYTNAKQQLKTITIYLIPINITLGIIAIYLGITLRGV